ncbi:MAG: hypothetical protein AVDCRST_MAG41-2376, partial [uncultured Corynebacteriales bacterium]
VGVPGRPGQPDRGVRPAAGAGVVARLLGHPAGVLGVPRGQDQHPVPDRRPGRAGQRADHPGLADQRRQHQPGTGAAAEPARVHEDRLERVEGVRVVPDRRERRGPAPERVGVGTARVGTARVGMAGVGSVRRRGGGPVRCQGRQPALGAQGGVAAHRQVAGRPGGAVLDLAQVALAV